MPDYSMCSGLHCPFRETCQRYKAEPNPQRQSYFLMPPYDKEKKECDHYWKIEKEEDQ